MNVQTNSAAFPAWVSNTGRTNRTFSSHERSDKFCGLPSLHVIGQWGVFNRGKAAGMCVDHSTLSVLLSSVRISGTLRVLLFFLYLHGKHEYNFTLEKNYLINFKTPHLC